MVRCLAHGAITCYGGCSSPGSALWSARTVVPDKAIGGESDGSGRFDRARGATDPGTAACRAGHLRRQGPRHQLPTDRVAAAARWRPQRPGGAAGRRRVRRLQRLRRPYQHPDRRAAGRPGPEVHPVPHHRAVRPDPGCPAHGPQPPRRRDGRDHRACHLRARVQLAAPQHLRALGRGPQAQRLLDGPVRQVPRGAGVAGQPDGPLRRLADRERVRALLRVHRRGDQPVRPGHLPGHRAGGARPDPRGGLPLHRGHDRPGDRLGAPAEGPDGRQAVLHVLRPRGHPRPPPCPHRVGRQVQGQVRPRLGPAARGDDPAAEGARRGSRPTPSLPAATTRSRPGTTCPTS